MSGIGATGFAAALKKLKKGKNSSHGLTAEVVQNLPVEQRAQLSAVTTRRMGSPDLPEVGSKPRQRWRPKRLERNL